MMTPFFIYSTLSNSAFQFRLVFCVDVFVTHVIRLLEKGLINIARGSLMNFVRVKNSCQLSESLFMLPVLAVICLEIYVIQCRWLFRRGSLSIKVQMLLVMALKTAGI